MQKARGARGGAAGGWSDRSGRGFGGRLLVAGVLLLEALDAAGGVHELLLARIERMALGADVHHERPAGGVGVHLVAAGAADGGGLVDRVNPLLRHGALDPSWLLFR